MGSFKLLALALSLLPACLAAQEISADSTQFHAGQWGLQFGSNFDLANVGILKFTSPHSAWMLLLEFNGATGSGTSVDQSGTPTDVHDHSIGFGMGIGRRFYQTPRHKVRSFQSVGLRAGYSDLKQTLATVTPSIYKNTQWAAGVFGELGAGYWVTPNLSLGGTGTVSASYTHGHTESPSGDVKEHGWAVSGVQVLLVVGLYF